MIKICALLGLILLSGCNSDANVGSCYKITTYYGRVGYIKILKVLKYGYIVKLSKSSDFHELSIPNYILKSMTHNSTETLESIDCAIIEDLNE